MKNNIKIMIERRKKLSKQKMGSIILVIVVILIIAGLFIGYNIYRYPAMFRNLSDESLNDEEVNHLLEEKRRQEEINVLVAYFSQTGNTEMMAEEIQSQIGGDLFKIETVEEYPSSYTELTQVAQTEIENGERPELKQAVENMEDYDIIFIGYPIWWHTTPAAVNSFLESYDLSGKTVVPFCTSGGSDIEETMEAVRNSCPNSNIAEGMTISGSSSSTDAGKEQIRTWLEALDI